MVFCCLVSSCCSESKLEGSWVRLLREVRECRQLNDIVGVAVGGAESFSSIMESLVGRLPCLGSPLLKCLNM